MSPTSFFFISMETYYLNEAQRFVNKPRPLKNRDAMRCQMSNIPRSFMFLTEDQLYT